MNVKSDRIYPLYYGSKALMIGKIFNHYSTNFAYILHCAMITVQGPPLYLRIKSLDFFNNLIIIK